MKNVTLALEKLELPRAPARSIPRSLAGALLIVLATNYPAAAAFEVIVPGDYLTLESIQTEMQLTRRQSIAVARELAAIAYLLEATREKSRLGMEELNPPLRNGGPLRERDRLKGEIWQLTVYFFILDVPRSARVRIVALNNFLDPLLKKADSITAAGGEIGPRLRSDIDMFRARIEFRETAKSQAEAMAPTLRPPAFVPPGVTPKAHLDRLVGDLEKINAKIVELRKNLSVLSGDLARLNERFRKKDIVAREHGARYFGLLALANKRYIPATVRSVKVYSLSHPRQSETLFYEASFSEPDEIAILDGQIALYEKMLPAAAKALEDANSNLKRTEKEFLDIKDKWLAGNQRYGEMLVDESEMNIFLELADVTIGLARDGFNPASIVFEAVYRTAEAALWGDVSIKESIIGDDIARRRQAVAKQLQHPDLPAALPSNPQEMLRNLRDTASTYIQRARVYGSFGDRMAVHFEIDPTSDQGGELVKGIVSKGVGVTLRGITREIVRRQIAGNATLGAQKNLDWLFLATAFHPDLTIVQFENIMRYKGGGGSFLQASNTPDAFKKIVGTLRGDLGDVTGTMMDALKKKIRDPRKYLQASGDLAFGAVVTFAKEYMKIPAQEKRAELAVELALMDMEWMIRRYDFQMAAKVRRSFVRAMVELEGSIGELIEQRSKIGRVLTVSVSRTLSTADTLRVIVEFDQKLDEAHLILNSEKYMALEDSRRYSFDTSGVDVPAGKYPLGIGGGIDGKGGPLRIDGDPATRAAYYSVGDGEASWRNYEKDDSEPEFLAINVEDPVFEIVDKRAFGYPPGTSFKVHYELPGTLPFRDIELKFQSSDARKVVDLRRRLIELRESDAVANDPLTELDFKDLQEEIDRLERQISADDAAFIGDGPVAFLQGKNEGDVQIQVPGKTGDFQVLAFVKGREAPIGAVAFRVTGPPVSIRASIKGTDARATLPVGEK